MTAFTGQLLSTEADYRRERIAADFARVARRRRLKARRARRGASAAHLRAARAG